jgi:hypothetical protein
MRTNDGLLHEVDIVNVDPALSTRLRLVVVRKQLDELLHDCYALEEMVQGRQGRQEVL